MTDRELMQMALDALEAAISDDQPYISRSEEAVKALRASLAQPEQRMGNCLLTGVCAAEGHRIQKAQHEWQALTDEEIMDACSAVWASHPIEVGRVVEEKLKEKNT